MLSEIGSNFWLNPDQELTNKSIGTPEQFCCKGSDYVWLSTGRSAINFVINSIESRKPRLKKVAVLPSFTCDTVFEPFLRNGFKVYYYPIENDLTTSSDNILKTVIEHDASIVLFHRYFGFNTLDGQINRMCEILRDLGKWTIEDCTQCLYSDIPRSNSDFYVGSIRKWTGTPDGGFAVCRNGSFNGKPSMSDTALEQAKIKAFYAKYRYLYENLGTKAEMLKLYCDAENILNNQDGYFNISETSAKVQANLDIDKLVKMRTTNFIILRKSLKGPVIPLFSLINYNCVPLYFPILVENRTVLQKHLAENSIYAPVVWPKDEQQPKQCEGAEYAYQHLLCIPIDQRYDAGDMNRIVTVINDFYK